MLFFSVNQIQTISYDRFHASHSSDADGQMTYFDWSVVNSLNLIYFLYQESTFLKILHIKYLALVEICSKLH